MPMKNILKQCALASIVATASLMAQTPYDEGQKALRDQRWQEAAEQFEMAVESDREQADSATYWRAYALFKAGRNSEAERELNRLERKYPDSRWIKEAQTLRIEHQDSDRSIEQMTATDTVMDEELKLFALAQLIERDPERAMPLLLDLLHNSESRNIRQDALFVLAMSEEPEALRVLSEVAQNSSNPDMQISAIHILGSVGSDAALPLLTELYTKDASTEVKRAIIEAFSISGDSSMLKQVLESETDPDIRQAAISGIAMDDGPDAAAYLETLYENSSSSREKADILDALIMLDESDALAMKIIQSEKDPELQRKAIHVLGINESTDALGELYNMLPDTQTRKAVLESLSIAGDSDALIQILESEQDEELRMTAINYLAVTDDENASQYFKKLYFSGSRQEKEAVIQSMLIMDDSQGLIELMKQEKDPELKRQMLQMLTLMDSEETDQYLFDLLENEQ